MPKNDATTFRFVLATEPAAARETNERLLPRFLEAVPRAEVARPGCRDPVLADLGARAGELVADWLRGLEHT